MTPTLPTTATRGTPRRAKRPAPAAMAAEPGVAWAAAVLLPRQGNWDAEDYLKLTDYTNRMAELVNDCIEVLPVPTRRHQAVLRYLFRIFDTVMQRLGGEAFFSPLRVRLPNGNFREPDLLLLLSTDDPRNQDRSWLGADLVLEVVSPDDPNRDLVDKRADYAAAGIPEYWIVDPQTETITVLYWVDAAEPGTYAEHDVFGRGSHASSISQPVITVDVDAAFNAR